MCPFRGSVENGGLRNYKKKISKICRNVRKNINLSADFSNILQSLWDQTHEIVHIKLMIYTCDLEQKCKKKFCSNNKLWRCVFENSSGHVTPGPLASTSVTSREVIPTSVSPLTTDVDLFALHSLEAVNRGSETQLQVDENNWPKIWVIVL